MTVVGRDNGQNSDWPLPGSAIILGSFDTGVGNFCCGEGTSGGVLLCVYIVHPCQCRDGVTLILMWGIFVDVASEVCGGCVMNVYFNNKNVFHKGKGRNVLHVGAKVLVAGGLQGWQEYRTKFFKYFHKCY